jgi:hypothetical protein
VVAGMGLLVARDPSRVAHPALLADMEPERPLPRIQNQLRQLVPPPSAPGLSYPAGLLPAQRCKLWATRGGRGWIDQTNIRCMFGEQGRRWLLGAADDTVMIKARWTSALALASYSGRLINHTSRLARRHACGPSCSLRRGAGSGSGSGAGAGAGRGRGCGISGRTWSPGSLPSLRAASAGCAGGLRIHGQWYSACSRQLTLPMTPHTGTVRSSESASWACAPLTHRWGSPQPRACVGSYVAACLRAGPARPAGLAAAWTCAAETTGWPSLGLATTAQGPAWPRTTRPIPPWTASAAGPPWPA